MPSGIEDAEVKIIGTDELPPKLGEVVRDLCGNMPEGSSAVVQVTNPTNNYYLRFGRTVSKILQESSAIQANFPLQELSKRDKGHKKLFVLSPNTWLAGGPDQQTPADLKYGLFTQIEGRYSTHEVCCSLGLTPRFSGDLHSSLDPEKLTGRASGAVSLILERQYLEKVQVVHFQPALVNDLRLLNTLVDYPLGDLRFFVARGESFLKAYAMLLKEYGISTNLSALL